VTATLGALVGRAETEASSPVSLQARVRNETTASAGASRA
jgi:hypothetical protein